MSRARLKCVVLTHISRARGLSAAVNVAGGIRAL